MVGFGFIKVLVSIEGQRLAMATGWEVVGAGVKAVFAACAVGEGVGGGGSNGGAFGTGEWFATGSFVFCDEGTGFFRSGSDENVEMPGHGKATGGFADNDGFTVEGEAIPIVDDGGFAVLEAKMFDAPIGMADDY